MRNSIHAPLCAIVSFFCFVADATSEARSGEERVTLGRVEYVVMEDVRMKLKARIDTGAGISSIDAKIVKIKPAADGSGEKVVFQIKDEEGKLETIERTIREWVEIKSRGKQADRRPVVRLDFCLGGKRLEGRINLADRSTFVYPVLIGRNLLETGDFLVDPGKKFTKEPGCSAD